MSFKHMGVLKGGMEQPPTATSESWAGATENYALEEKDGATELTVTMDITPNLNNISAIHFPKALEKVKELAENITIYRCNMTDNEKTVIAFLKMIEAEGCYDELEKFYHPEVQQKEFPNAVTSTTAVRSLADLKLGAKKGRKVITKESYEVVQLHSCGAW